MRVPIVMCCPGDDRTKKPLHLADAGVFSYVTEENSSLAIATTQDQTNQAKTSQSHGAWLGTAHYSILNEN